MSYWLCPELVYVIVDAKSIAGPFPDIFCRHCHVFAKSYNSMFCFCILSLIAAHGKFKKKDLPSISRDAS